MRSIFLVTVPCSDREEWAPVGAFLNRAQAELLFQRLARSKGSNRHDCIHLECWAGENFEVLDRANCTHRCGVTCWRY